MNHTNITSPSFPVPAAFTTASFSDVLTQDVFAQAEALPKWRQEYLQISKGPFKGRLIDVSLGPIQLFRETMDKAVDQHGEHWINSIAVGVPVRTEGDGFWCGEALSADSVFFLKPNAELRFRTPMSSDIQVAVIDLQLLERYAQSTEIVDIGLLRQLSGVERAPRQLCADLRQRFQKIFDGVGANPHTLADERSCQLLCDDIMYTLFDVMASLGKIQPHMPGQIVHRYIVEKSREYILSRRNQPPTVAEVCQELHISRRTLHYAFQKVLDINPVTFLRYIRLHGIRQELLSMLPGQHFINEVAARWGFWHLGMFSTYYKQLFGETPSDTIRKATPKA